MPPMPISRRDVPILDERGHLSTAQTGGTLLFRVIGKPDRRKSVIVTTHRASGEWLSVVDAARVAVALLDRLTVHSETVETGSYSWHDQRRAWPNPKARKPVAAALGRGSATPGLLLTTGSVAHAD